jgi:arylsulfatase A-like enzyme
VMWLRMNSVTVRTLGRGPRRASSETYRGGSTDPFILSWPAGITAKGQVRTRYAHIIDMVPTLLGTCSEQRRPRLCQVDAASASARRRSPTTVNGP